MFSVKIPFIRAKPNVEICVLESRFYWDVESRHMRFRFAFAGVKVRVWMRQCLLSIFFWLGLIVVTSYTWSFALIVVRHVCLYFIYYKQRMCECFVWIRKSDF